MLNKNIKAWSNYQIGDKIKYNEIEFYVIKNSDKNDDKLTLLKSEPLTYEEVTSYLSETEITVSNRYGYGAIIYHSNSNEYSESYTKMVVDAWKIDKIPNGLIEARLITYDEYVSLSELEQNCNSTCNEEIVPIYDWVYNNDYWYWTMSPYKEIASPYFVYNVMNYSGGIGPYIVNDSHVGSFSTVRPVITLLKSTLGDVNESDIVDISSDDNIKQENDSINEKISKQVNVPNTYLNSSLIIIIIGFVIAGVGIVIYYKLKKRESK